jgi:hypothetical protein
MLPHVYPWSIGIELCKIGIEIVWSDETKINRFGSDGHQWVWKAPREGINMHTCMPTMKHGGGFIMV